MKVHIVSEKGGRSNNEDAVRGRRKNETRRNRGTGLRRGCVGIGGEHNFRLL